MRWVKAIGSQWLATAYVGAVSMLLAFFLGRKLGAEGFGVYSYVLTIGSLYLIFQDGGYRTLIFREKTAGSAGMKQFLPDLLPLATGQAMAASIAALGLILILPAREKGALAAAVVCFFLVAVSNFVSSFLRGEGRFELEAGWQIIVRTATAGMIAIGVLVVLPAPGVVFWAWAAGLGLALSLPTFRSLLRRPRWALPPRNIWQASAAFLVIDAATVLYFRIDIVLLRNMLADDAQVGNYAAAYRLLEGVILLLSPVALVCFRHLRLHAEMRRAFARSLGRMLIAMAALAVGVLALGVLAGPWVVQATFGGQYAVAARLVPWLFGALVFIMPNYILTQAAVALNRERFYAVSAVLAAGMNVGLNLWLIPRFGPLGAAWATIATEAALAAMLGGAMIQWLRKRA